MKSTLLRCPRCGSVRSNQFEEDSCATCLAEIAWVEFMEPLGDMSVSDPPRQPHLTTLGPYQLLQEIARGGMGVVYRARQAGLNRDVAVKVILAGPFAGSETLARFRIEAQAAARLRHPNIVTVHAFGEMEGHQWLSMDLIVGPTLAAMTRNGPLPAAQAARYLRKVADAVEHAHQLGVIHRDLKPGNVLIDLDDEPRVTDFGLAKQMDQAESLTVTGQALGTPGFASPEQLASNRGAVDVRSDVYGLGALLYHLLVGRAPFLADSLAETVDQVMHSEPIAPRILNPSVPQDLETLCLKCLSKEPARRYQTASDLAEDLRRWQTGQPILARPTPRWERLMRWSRRNPTFAALIGAVALLCVTVAMVSAISSARLAKANRETQHQHELLKAFSEQQSLQLAESNFRQDSIPMGLAQLSAILRQDPSNSVASQRLMSALTQRLFLLPLTEPLPHNDIVHRIRFSPDGRQLATGSSDGKVRLWDIQHLWNHPPIKPPHSQDARSGSNERSQTEPNLTLHHPGAVWWFEYNHDGSLLGTACSDLTARLWNPSTGEALTEPLRTVDPATLPSVGFGRIAPFADIRGLTSFDFNPSDGSFVVSGRHGRADLWSYDGQTPRFQRAFAHSNHVFRACFSPDGRLLATAGFDRSARVWETSTGRVLFDLQHIDRVFWVEFSPDGSRVVTAERGGFVRIWDVKTGRQLTVIEHRMEATFAHFSHDGLKLASGSEDGSVQVADTTSGAKLFWKHQKARITEARFSPDDSLLATISEDQFLRLYDLKSRELYAEPARHGAGILDVVFSPDGLQIATASLDQTARVWAVPRRPVQPRFQHKEFIYAATFSRDARKLLTCSADFTAVLWDIATGNKEHIFQHDGRVLSARFNADESMIITASSDRTARLWNASTGIQLGGPIQHSEPVEGACFSPDGQWVLTASNDGRTRMTHIVTRETRQLVGVEKDVRNAYFSPDGKTIITVAEENVARLWDSTTGMPLGQPMPHAYWVLSAAFSPDGRIVATACKDGAMRLWDARTGKPLTAPVRHESAIPYLTFSRDGRFLGTVSDDHTAKLWDSVTALPLSEPFRHQDKVTHLAFDGSTARVATVSFDQTARLWDLGSGMPISEPLIHGDTVRHVEFSCDGQRLVTAVADLDPAAVLWETPVPPLPVPKWLPEIAESLAGGRLTSHGFTQTGPVPTISALGEQTTRGDTQEFYRQWANWFFEVSSKLPRHPFKVPDSR